MYVYKTIYMVFHIANLAEFLFFECLLNCIYFRAPQSLDKTLLIQYLFKSKTVFLIRMENAFLNVSPCKKCGAHKLAHSGCEINLG